jgi:hypothetical protein
MKKTNQIPVFSFFFLSFLLLVLSQNCRTQSNDNRVGNATKAKMPKGKMSFLLDGKTITLPENSVQCMYVGMNSTMAQAVISGGNQVSITHMGKPQIGEIKNTGSIPTVALQVIVAGEPYTNVMNGGTVKFTITKIKPDGNNYYVAGTFSGTLKTADRKKSITITNGVFESAYL